MDGESGIPDSSATTSISISYYLRAYPRSAMAGTHSCYDDYAAKHCSGRRGDGSRGTWPGAAGVTLGDDVRQRMNWLAERGLLHISYTCPRCQVLCSLVLEQDSQDGFRWKCRQCHHPSGVRKDAFFKSKLSLGSWCGCYSLGHRTPPCTMLPGISTCRSRRSWTGAISSAITALKIQ